MRQMTRREMLGCTAAGVAGTATWSLTKRSTVYGAERPPNVIVIMSDEHTASITGCYGNRTVQTPHLDELAARGVVFDNCYCNSPLCVPSRLSFTSGKYVSRVSAWNNDCELPSADYPSLPGQLNAAGYESFLCGKQHYAGSRRYGFVDVGGKMNNSKKTGRTSRRKADDLTSKGLSERFNDFRVGEGNGVIKHDLKVTAGTCEFLAKRKATDKPFFLFSGFLAPHFPLIVPESFYTPYQGKVPMPEIPAGHLESLALNYKHLRTGFKMTNVPDEIVRRGRELYYGFTQWVDNEIGQVLKVLADSPFADNTVVIYTTDHGENMGEHGLWWKNCMYEHAARVPLIVSYPERWKGGQRRAGACSLVDVVQTIANVGQTTVPEDWNGTSLCKWLDDPQTKWKDQAVSEYYAHNIASGYAMLRSGAFKYVYHTSPDGNHPAQRELYDLSTDSGEFKNLAGETAQHERIQSMHADLLKELGADPEETERRCRAEGAKGYAQAIA